MNDRKRLMELVQMIHRPIVPPHVISVEDVRAVLMRQSEEVLQTTGNKKKGLIVLVKPSDQSNYKNLVDVIDELAITKVN